MKKRNRLSRRRSRKMFRKGASKTHRYNVMAAPGYMMRGGIRM